MRCVYSSEILVPYFDRDDTARLPQENVSTIGTGTSLAIQDDKAVVMNVSYTFPPGLSLNPIVLPSSPFHRFTLSFGLSFPMACHPFRLYIASFTSYLFNSLPVFVLFSFSLYFHASLCLRPIYHDPHLPRRRRLTHRSPPGLAPRDFLTTVSSGPARRSFSFAGPGLCCVCARALRVETDAAGGHGSSFSISFLTSLGAPCF